LSVSNTAITRRPFDGSHDYHIIARCRVEVGPISPIPLSIDVPSGVGDKGEAAACEQGRRRKGKSRS
jgi:hypothetical protein